MQTLTRKKQRVINNRLNKMEERSEVLGSIYEGLRSIDEGKSKYEYLHTDLINVFLKKEIEYYQDNDEELEYNSLEEILRGINSLINKNKKMRNTEKFLNYLYENLHERHMRMAKYY